MHSQMRCTCGPLNKDVSAYISTQAWLIIKYDGCSGASGVVMPHPPFFYSVLSLKSGCDQYLRALFTVLEGYVCVCVCVLCQHPLRTSSNNPHTSTPPTHTHTHTQTRRQHQQTPLRKSPIFTPPPLLTHHPHHTHTQADTSTLPLQAIPTRMLNTIQMSASRIDWNDNS